MRKIAQAVRASDGIRRVMLFEGEGGTYLFLYTSLEDSHCDADEWYESTLEAEAVSKKRYGISETAWQIINDPLDGCQHDWIAAVRVKGRDVGKPEWGIFEKYESGTWKPMV